MRVGRPDREGQALTRALCTFQTYKDGRLMVCTLPAGHVHNPEERQHLLWAGKKKGNR